jgi:hypothetical protein
MRTVAREYPSPDVRAMLQLLADKLDSAITALYHSPTVENMRELNAAWVRAHVYFNEVPDVHPPDPIKDRMAA